MAVSLLSKFRGSLIGGLLGDCLGAPFEGDGPVLATRVNLYFAQLFNPKVRVPYKPYTDDTVMSKAIAESLIENKGLNASELAKRFTTDYFAEPKRGYGASVHDVFMGLRNGGFEDPFYPARKLFGGQGSFGNGAAMRIAPAALFAHKEIPKLLEIASQASRITHSHNHGIRGATLQSLAVRQALLLDAANKNFDETEFLDSLIKALHEIESQDPVDEFSKFDDGSAEEFRRTYVKKLKTVKEFLKRPEIPSIDEIHKELGAHVAAINSVPTAIYCVLLARNPIPGLEGDNQFLRSIQFAISLGGDTDTIASMAGSISGAHLGYEAIPQPLLKHCEAPEKILKVADELYAASV